MLDINCLSQVCQFIFAESDHGGRAFWGCSSTASQLTGRLVFLPYTYILHISIIPHDIQHQQNPIFVGYCHSCHNRCHSYGDICTICIVTIIVIIVSCNNQQIFVVASIVILPSFWTPTAPPLHRDSASASATRAKGCRKGSCTMKSHIETNVLP